MRLVLYLEPSAIELTEPSAGGPFPYLLNVGELRVQVRAGYLSGLGVGEAPSLPVTLSNDGKRAAGIIRQPLRVRAEVYRDTGELYFAGLVADVAYGRAVELGLEA